MNMPLTNEQRAEISRQNGAKSRGPVTPEGKARSSRNALKHGDHADTLKAFVPPHPAVLCNEDRQAFYEAMDMMIARYQPSDPVSLNVVREIANAHWHLQRYSAMHSALWNVELLRQAQEFDSTLAPELHEMEVALAAGKKLFVPGGTLGQISREMDRLHNRISKLERRLHFLEARFPIAGAAELANTDTDRALFCPEAVAEPEEDEASADADAATAPERTCDNSPQTVENTPSEPENPQTSEPVDAGSDSPKILEINRPARVIPSLPDEEAA